MITVVLLIEQQGSQQFVPVVVVGIVNPFN